MVGTHSWEQAVGAGEAVGQFRGCSYKLSHVWDTVKICCDEPFIAQEWSSLLTGHKKFITEVLDV